MRIITLYTLCTVWVLLLVSCSRNEPEKKLQTAPPTTTEQPEGATPPASENSTVVLVLGNSLAAGYGLDPDDAFPHLIQRRLDSLGWAVDVINAGLSGETTAAGARRIEWLLRRKIDVLIIELGGNDGLRGITPDVTKQNLQVIFDKTRAIYPEVRFIIAGMQIPPNLGQEYTGQFRQIFSQLAEENDAALIPFLLEGVGGVAHLMQNDGIHPTREGQRNVAENVWVVLEPILRTFIPPS